MTLPTSPSPSESTQKIGKVEGALLGVLGLIALLITGGAVAISIVSLVIGGGQVEIFTE